ncbi:hypothetical protein RND81_04G137400 [Saponaria officinalis]|uniref:40S ribosomal protein S6 n=1 Tax=Saponaria officinalis TaxID=3572 RepID=A0AAW1LLU7_SAPOF
MAFPRENLSTVGVPRLIPSAAAMEQGLNHSRSWGIRFTLRKMHKRHSSLSSNTNPSEFKGYIFKGVGAMSKVPMKQGVLTPGRVCLLLHRGTSCLRGYRRRHGERRRKSIRGCIVNPDLLVVNLVIVKKGEHDLPGLTNIEKPRIGGPKRASNIRKLLNLSKDDDVHKYVNTYRRTFTNKACVKISVKTQEIYDLHLNIGEI